MMWVRGVAVVMLLAATSSAEAQGSNVNANVTFTPVSSTYQTTTSTTGCPAGFSGKFTFTAVLTNKADSPAMPDLTVRVTNLSNLTLSGPRPADSVLLDPQTGEVLGGQGAEMTVPQVGQYADGLLSPGESVDVPFVLCEKTFERFQLFVDVFGVVTQLVSINRFGTGSGNSGVSTGFPAISANGRFVAFHSDASDLTANDTNGNTQDVFVRDLQMGTTTLVSINRLGTGSGNSGSSGSNGSDRFSTSLVHPPAISADARFVAFVSTASDLIANDTNGNIQDVFVRDLQMGTTTLVSVNQFGTGSGNDSSADPVISPDGRFVAFVSRASDLTAHDDANGIEDVFVRDLQMGTTTLVSINRFGTGSGDSFSKDQALSADGRFVAFMSQASDLTANANGGPNVFVRDLQMETTTLVSVNRFGTAPGNHRSRSAPTISADGRFVLFSSEASDLTANDTNGNTIDTFVRDLQTGTTTLVSVNRFGTGSGNGTSADSGMSADGRFVAISSTASDLIANDTNGTTFDLFVRDLQMGTTTLVSVNRFGTGSGNGISLGAAAISADGRFVAFVSQASNLTADGVSGSNVFVRDLKMGTTTLVSVNRSGNGSGNGSSDGPAISADGRFVAFESRATNLVTTNDINGSQEDIFVRPVAP